MGEIGYIEKGGRKLRLGYTTGSCAAAASAAAARMLLTGSEVRQVRIGTPAGTALVLEIEEIRRGENWVRCAVRKDSGDDPDVTDGALIAALVKGSDQPGIRIEGGEGVGRVTRPGLDQPVGAAAINSTPRRMIAEAVSLEMREYGGINSPAGMDVTISVPEGGKLAAKTFNPKLGIVGGISILGTSGIVNPMSDEALLATIRAEISVRRSEGLPVLAAAPGNYGKNFFLEKYGFSLDTCVTTSNFICDALQMAAEAGFKKFLLIGHIGKLVKVAGGVRNTHSRYGDRRMEILEEITAGIVRTGRGPAIGREEYGRLREALLSCVTTDEAVGILKERGLDGPVLEEMTGRIKTVLEAWSHGGVQAETIVFSNKWGELGRTARARAFMEEVRTFGRQE
ncbi:MAG: cobalamin biosynthesis protein CbiD [Lachnospiraceae bacterium]|nr:cobalamin biosynthesis protein CbiD [Lachnospiraceae bacterium]